MHAEHIASGLNFLQILPALHTVPVTVCSRVRSACCALREPIRALIGILNSIELIWPSPPSLTLTTVGDCVHWRNHLGPIIFFDLLDPCLNRLLREFIGGLNFRRPRAFAPCPAPISLLEKRILLFHRERVGLER